MLYPLPQVIYIYFGVGFSLDFPKSIISWQMEINDTHFGIISMPSTHRALGNYLGAKLANSRCSVATGTLFA